MLSPVLVVEDDRTYAALLQVVLGRHGIRADVVTCGRDALRVLRYRSYAAIVLDLGLPDLHGLDVAEQLRELPGARDARIVALTGTVDDEVRDEATRRGVDVYRTKPIRASDLVDVLVEVA